MYLYNECIEASSALDPELVGKVLKVMGQLAEEGMGMILQDQGL